MNKKNGLRIGEAAFAAMVFCLGLFLAVETARLGAGPGYAVVGPRAFPTVIAVGLLILGALEFRSAVRGRTGDDAGLQLDWRAFGMIAAALVVELLLLTLVGWIPSATLLFFVVAWAFGNRSIAKGFLIGLALASMTFFTFNYLLGLALPWGSLFAPLVAKLGTP